MDNLLEVQRVDNGYIVRVIGDDMNAKQTYVFPNLSTMLEFQNMIWQDPE